MRPIEELTGTNLGKCDRLHVSTTLIEACRIIRPKNIRQASPALRRGLILAISQRLKQNFQLYVDVMQGTQS